MADIRDIAAMKIDAAAAAPRGFYRPVLYSTAINWRDTGFYDKKYGKLASNLVHIQKSLVFFEDAEVDEMPRMLKETKWKEVKSYFEHEVRKLAI